MAACGSVRALGLETGLLSALAVSSDAPSGVGSIAISPSESASQVSGLSISAPEGIAVMNSEQLAVYRECYLAYCRVVSGSVVSRARKRGRTRSKSSESEARDKEKDLGSEVKSVGEEGKCYDVVLPGVDLGKNPTLFSLLNASAEYLQSEEMLSSVPLERVGVGVLHIAKSGSGPSVADTLTAASKSMEVKPGTVAEAVRGWCRPVSGDLVRALSLTHVLGDDGPLAFVPNRLELLGIDQVRRVYSLQGKLSEVCEISERPAWLAIKTKFTRFSWCADDAEIYIPDMVYDAVGGYSGPCNLVVKRGSVFSFGWEGEGSLVLPVSPDFTICPVDVAEMASVWHGKAIVSRSSQVSSVKPALQVPWGEVDAVLYNDILDLKGLDRPKEFSGEVMSVSESLGRHWGRVALVANRELSLESKVTAVMRHMESLHLIGLGTVEVSRDFNLRQSSPVQTDLVSFPGPYWTDMEQKRALAAVQCSLGVSLNVLPPTISLHKLAGSEAVVHAW